MVTTPAQPRKAPSQKRAQVTVEKVLQVTLDILREEGAESVTTRNISKKSGISPGSIYQYFGNKEQILYRIYGNRLQSTLKTVEAILTEDNLSLSFDEFWQLFTNLLKNTAWGTKEEIELNKAIAGNPELNKAIAPILGGIYHLLVKIMKSYGSKWPDTDLFHLAEYIFNIDHLGYQMRIYEGEALKERTRMITRDIQYYLFLKAIENTQ